MPRFPRTTRKFPSVLLCAVTILAATCHGVRAEDKADDAASWIAKLSSDDFDERTGALEKLAAMGESAHDALSASQAGNDPEIRIAAAQLLARLRLATVSVRVTDRFGNAIPKAEADYTIGDQYNGNEPSHQISVGADGAAKLPKIDPGVYNANFEWKKLFAAGQIANYYRLNLVSGANAIPFVMTTGGAVQGSVADDQGKPLQDARLTLLTDLSPELDVDDVAGGGGNQ